jgi:hypothetical protein
MLAPAALIEYGATIKYFRRACPELVEQGWEQPVTRHGRAGWDEVPLSSPKGRHTTGLAGTFYRRSWGPHSKRPVPQTLYAAAR